MFIPAEYADVVKFSLLKAAVPVFAEDVEYTDDPLEKTVKEAPLAAIVKYASIYTQVFAENTPLTVDNVPELSPIINCPEEEMLSTIMLLLEAS